jgi:hypothetical protein
MSSIPKDKSSSGDSGFSGAAAGVKDFMTPLLIYKPFSLALLLVFYSPLVVAIIILSMSFIFQNFKGIIYFIWLIVFVSCRGFIFELMDFNKYNFVENNICTMVQFSKYSNSGFSIFFIMFSLVYICGPMIKNRIVNWWMLSAFLFYLSLDILTRFRMGCFNDNWLAEIGLNLLLGAAFGILTLWGMYLAKLQDHLFFNETSSTKDMCSMPSNQTFKCSVYKNGELIGSTNA